MAKRLISVPLLKKVFDVNGWECKKDSDISYSFSKRRMETIFVFAESDKPNFVNANVLLTMLSGDIKNTLINAAQSVAHGIDIYIDRGKAADDHICNLYKAISDINEFFGGSKLHPELMPGRTMPDSAGWQGSFYANKQSESQYHLKGRRLPCVRLAEIVMSPKQQLDNTKSIAYTAGVIGRGLPQFFIYNGANYITSEIDVQNALIKNLMNRINSANKNELKSMYDFLKKSLNAIIEAGGTVGFDRRQLVDEMLFDYDKKDPVQYELCNGYLVDIAVYKSEMDKVDFTLSEIAASTSLPSSSVTISQITNTISNPGYETSELADIIKTDPVIAADVLKLAKSSYYARNAKIDGIETAIIRLGSNVLHCIAIAATMKKQHTNCRYFDYDRYWQESRARSIAARHYITRLLAKDSSGYSRDEIEIIDNAFTAGLLAKIGKLIYATVWPDDYSVICRLALDDSSGLKLKVYEKLVFGQDHNALAEEVLKRWGFSPNICKAVRKQDSDKDENQNDQLSVISALQYIPRILDVVIESLDGQAAQSSAATTEQEPDQSLGQEQSQHVIMPEWIETELEKIQQEYHELTEIF